MVPNIDSRFWRAVRAVRQIPALAADLRLQFYGLFKQATAGDNTTERPLHPDDLSRWTAWVRHRGLTKSQAETAYVSLLATHNPDWRPPDAAGDEFEFSSTSSSNSGSDDSETDSGSDDSETGSSSSGELWAAVL